MRSKYIRVQAVQYHCWHLEQEGRKQDMTKEELNVLLDVLCKELVRLTEENRRLRECKTQPERGWQFRLCQEKIEKK